MTDPPGPQDELACARLMSRASHHADLNQIDAFVGLFAEDGWVDRTGERFTGPAAIPQPYGRPQACDAPRAHHVPSNLKDN